MGGEGGGMDGMCSTPSTEKTTEELTKVGLSAAFLYATAAALKQAIKRDKESYYTSLASKIQQASENGNLKTLHTCIKKVCYKKLASRANVKDKESTWICCLA